MTPLRICLLTFEDLINHPDGKLAVDDAYFVRELEQRGHFVEQVAWNRFDLTSKFDHVIVRTTWDYTERCDEFLAKMQAIEQSGLSLINPYSILKWNSHKSYLIGLSEQGVPIAPTQFLRAGDSLREIECKIAGWPTQEWIFKPAVSATSSGLIRVKKFELSAALLQSQASGKDFLIQPFLPEILEGEVSLNFFSKKYSHAVIKRPRSGDFRVQEAFGGAWESCIPTAAEVKFCGSVLSLVPDPLLIARVDFVRTSEGPKLMELELIEPMLYFGSAPDIAAANLANALLQYHSAPTES